jgi:uncharacterized protein (PEP-CTERM system associated)
LFSTAIPDPVARAQMVAAYIRATGLPPSLANNVNYLSNRYILQKQFQASAAFNVSHSTLIFTVADTRRNALSLINTDSPLLGSNNSSLNDDTHQTSAGANVNWRLSSRTSVDLAALYNKARSLSLASRTDTTHTVRLGLRRQLGSTLSAAMEVRRTKGTSLDGARDYTENALSASLNKHF